MRLITLKEERVSERMNDIPFFFSFYMRVTKLTRERERERMILKEGEIDR